MFPSFIWRLFTFQSGQPTQLVLDCANGVGAKAMRSMVEYLKGDYLTVKFANEQGELNHEVGVYSSFFFF